MGMAGEGTKLDRRRIALALFLGLAVLMVLPTTGPVPRPAQAVTSIPDSMGPGVGTILIHEFPNVTAEMDAFIGGSIDMVNSPVPPQYVQVIICGAYPCPGAPCPPACGLDAILSYYRDLDMFQIDINNWNWPTDDRALRQAIGYLVDRQQIVNVFAGAAAVPICAGTAAGQPGSKSCLQLGYPTSFGDFNPSKALQILYEGGWRDLNGNGIMEAPGGQEPTLTVLTRVDDLVRRQAGLLLMGQLGNLPSSFNDQASGTVTVCSGTPVCKINTSDPCRLLGISCSTTLLYQPSAWHIYMGGWDLPVDPDHLYYLYTSPYASTQCGGGWPFRFALNYVCNVDPAYDSKASGTVTGQTYNDVISAAFATQDYAWGYNATTGRVTGTMPTVPIYTLQAPKAGWRTDHGATPLMNPDGTRACWRGFLGQEVGVGLDNLAGLTGMSLDNCQQSSGYLSYAGQGTLDWGFGGRVQSLNVVTSYFASNDQLAMRQTYQGLLDRNPVNLKEFVPVLAESYGEYVSTQSGHEATVAVFKLRPDIYWSDGARFTGSDVRFSIEYVQKNYGTNFSLVSDVTSVQVSTDGLVVRVFFDHRNPLLTGNLGTLPTIPQHVWCPDYNPSAGLDVGPGVPARPGCPYPDPSYFPDFDFTKHVGTGPYTLTGCTGTNCSETITLSANPLYRDGTRFWDVPAGISLQPDVNRDGRIDQTDLDLLSMVNASEARFDVDYRIVEMVIPLWVVCFDNYGSVFCDNLSLTLKQPAIDSTDKYIVQHLIFEGQQDGNAVLWPPGKRMTYNWPDVNKDGAVDLDDVISVYLHQFQNPTAQPISHLAMNDVDYDGDIDIDDLTITFLRQFTKPAGAP